MRKLKLSPCADRPRPTPRFSPTYTSSSILFSCQQTINIDPMSEERNTPIERGPGSPGDGAEPPTIEQPSTAISQRRMDAVLRFFDSPDAVILYGNVVRASIIAEELGVCVVGVTTSKHYDLAIKMRNHLHPSERDMADFAAKATNKVLTGRMYGWHRIILDEAERRETSIMVGDRTDGETVATVWKKMGWRELRSFKNDITTQLTAHISRMRTIKQPFIGRVGRDGQSLPQKTRNFYDGPVGGYFGPFTDAKDPEKAFDEWAIDQLPDSKERAKWKKTLEKDRQKRGSSCSFVLTHADLTWNNIMVAKDSTSGKYVITGLIDWDRSAFLPEYAEYAVLSVVSFHSKAWLKVLRAAVPRGGCSRDRLAFTRILQSVCNPMAMGR